MIFYYRDLTEGKQRYNERNKDIRRTILKF